MNYIDYDEVFKDDVTRKFFYSDYPGNKIVVGKISLENAIARLNRDEYYTLVTYKEGDKLPAQYIPLNSFESDDGTLFATFNPNNRFSDICANNGIQRISRLSDSELGGPVYLLGPGPNEVVMSDIVNDQFLEYTKSHSKNK